MIVLVRHGRTQANAEGRLIGRTDLDLDELGARQAQAVADVIGPVDRVIASPLVRTRSTAKFLGHEVEIDERWIELDYGDWDGRPVADIGAVHWDRWRGDLDFAPPGGESLRSLGNRVREACADLATAAVDETVVVVTHVSPLKAAVAWALGVGDDVSWRCFVAPASITRVRLTLAGPTLVSFNEAGHLAGVGPSGNW